MNNQYQKKIAISKSCFVLSNVGNGWEKCWAQIQNGTQLFSKGSDFIPNWPDSPPLSIIEKVSADTDATSFKTRTNDAAYYVASQMKKTVDDLFLKDPDVNIHIVVATSHSDPGPLSELVDISATNQFEKVTDDIAQGILSDSLIHSINRGLGRELSGTTTSAACAGSLISTSYACDMIDFGIADAILLVAIDTLSRVATVAFNNIGAMSQTGCTPYSKNRDGTTVGEGAVALLLAKEDLLDKEDISGYITGTSVYCDAAHMVEPNPQGVATTIQKALDQSDIPATQITSIYFHGTGTVQNDKTESEAAKIIFGESSPSCTSTKGVLGHTMGASGCFNILAGLETLNTGILPPVARSKDNAFPNLNVVLHKPCHVAKNMPVLITALGFGGINSALVLEKTKRGTK